MAKLRIVHVSDLHLFVERDGRRRPLAELNTMIKVARRLARMSPRFPVVGGFNTHDADALDALLTTVTDLIDRAPGQVVLVQTGDVSTFGLRRRPRFHFPEWEFWEGERRRRHPDLWIDLFGNHDVWPGTLPIAGQRRVRVARDGLRALHVPAQMPEQHVVQVGGDRVELYTLNTVQHAALANTFADGAIEFDRPTANDPPTYRGPSGSTDPLEYIHWMARNHGPKDPGAQVLRVLLMHHPPRFFGVRNNALAWWDKLTSGVLLDEAMLNTWLYRMRSLRSLPVHLVLAGHRHKLDPALHQVPKPLTGNQTIQLVCGTPTQFGEEHSLSVYEVEFDGGRFTVDRVVYDRDATDVEFHPGTPERII